MICEKWLHIYGNKLGTGVNCEWVDDVRENVRGEWLSMFGHNVCNKCGFKIDIVPTNFCPNCGADMRGENG